MTIDVSTLGISVDSSGVIKGTADLDKLTDAGGRAEESAKKAGSGYSKFAASLAADMGRMIAALDAMNASQARQEKMMTVLIGSTDNVTGAIGRMTVGTSASVVAMTAATAATGKQATSAGAAATATEKASLAIDKQIASIVAQTATLGMGARQAALYALTMQGATDAQLQQADAAIKTAESLKAAHKLGEDFGNAVKVGALALAAGVVAAAYSFEKLIGNVAKYQDLAEQTGADPAGLASLRTAADVGGASIESLVAAANRMQRSLAKVDDESKGVGNALASIGIHVEDFKKLKADEQLRAIGQALNEYADGGGKVAVIQGIMGRGATALLPTLKELGSETEKQIGLTTEQIQLADDYKDAQARSRSELVQLIERLSVSALPVVIDFTKAIKDTIVQLVGVGTAGKNLSEGEKITQFARSAAVFLANLADIGYAVGQSFNYVGTAIGGLAAMGATLARGDLTGAQAIDKALSADLKKITFTLGLADTLKQSFAARDKKNAEAVAGGSPDKPQVNYSEVKATKDKAAAVAIKLAYDQQIDDLKKYADESKFLNSELLKDLASIHASSVIGEQEYLRRKSDLAAEGIVTQKDALELEIGIAKASKLPLLQKQKAIEAFQKTLQDLNQAQVALGADFLRQQSDLNDKISDAMDKRVSDAEKAVKTLKDEQKTLRQEREEFGLTEQQIGALHIARANEMAVALERQAVTRDGIDLSGVESEQLREQAKLIRSNAADRVSNAGMKKSADAWKSFYGDIERGLTDSLYRGFEAGKGFFKTFWDGIKNLFKTTVLKLAIQGVVGGVTGALGLSSGAAGAGTSALGMANNASSLHTAYGLGSQALYGGSVGASTASLGFANGVGLAGGDSLGALALANGGWAGVAGPSSGLASSAVAANLALAEGTGTALTAGTVAAATAESAAAAAAASAATAATTAGAAATAGTGAAAAGGAAGAGAASGLAAIPVYGWIALAVIAVAAFFGGRGDKEATGGGIEGSFGKGGFEGNRFSTWKQDGGWFHSDRDGRDPSALDAEAQKQLAAGYAAVQVGAAQSALALGLSADAIVNYSEKISISLGSDQEENAKTISKLFSDMSNNMATAVAPGLSAFAKQGETASATLARLGGSLTTVNAWMGLLRGNLLDVSMASGDAASKLIDTFGGVEAMGNSVQQYYDLYFSESERAADTTARMTKAMASVGLALPETKDQFRDLAASLDLSTASGRTAYATMLNLAPAFATAADAIAVTAKATSDALAAAAVVAAEKAKAITEKRDELSLLLMRAQGDEAGAVAIERQKELDALYATSPALADMQKQIYGFNDAAKEAASAAAIAANDLAASTRAAAEAAATAKTIADKSDTLALALMRAQGDETGAVAIERNKELAALFALSPALSDMQSQIYGLSGATVAAAAVAATAATAKAAAEAAATTVRDKTESLTLALMRATGDETGAVAIERAKELAALQLLDPSLASLQQRLYDATDASSALAASTRATADAQAALYAQADALVASAQKSIAAQKTVLQTAYDAQVAAAQTTASALAEAASKAAGDAKQSAQDRLSAITDIFNTLDGALKSSQIESDALTAARRRAAQQVLSDAMAGARSGQSLTSFTGLQNALTEVAKPSQNLFKTFEEYALDQAKTSNDIYGLYAIAGAQKSVAQMTLDATIAAGDASIASNKAASDANLKALKDKFDADNKALDVQLAYWDHQLNALKGIDDRVLSVDDSIAKLVALQAQVLGVSGAAGGKATDAEIQGAWKSTGKSGADDGSIRQFYDLAIATGTSSQRVDSALGFTPGTALQWAVAQGLPSFDVGTDRVPRDMLAMLHKDEIVVPAAAAPAFRSGGQSGDSGELLAQVKVLTRRVEQLTEQVAADLAPVKVSTGIAATALDRSMRGVQPLTTTAVTA